MQWQLCVWERGVGKRFDCCVGKRFDCPFQYSSFRGSNWAVRVRLRLNHSGDSLKKTYDLINL